MNIQLPVPADFDLLPTVYSHGWCALAPFTVDKDRSALNYAYHVGSHRPFVIEVTQPRKAGLKMRIDGVESLDARKKHDVISLVRSCFRLDEELSEFYSQARKHPTFRWIPRKGAGRLLRAPTVFEDAVKMICTTNCSWALTETMVDYLCRTLGSRVGDSQFTFPGPEAIADCSEKFLRKEIHAGYRAPYLLELSRRIVKRDIDIESWRKANCSTEELYKEVQSVKGIGPYAGGNILKLLGRYDYLGIDSWCRKRFSELHGNGRPKSDKAIEKFYEPFGKWRGLFFWMDLTKNWYDKKFPF